MSNSRNYTLPLSRWHHVADRIRQFGETKKTNAYNVLAGTVIRNTLTDEQIASLEKRGQKAVEELDIARRSISVVANIRQSLAEANAEHKVNTILSKVEGLRKDVAFLRSFSSIDMLTKTPLNGVNAALEKAHGSERSRFSLDSINVTLINPETFVSFEEEALILDSQIASLTDEVADINRALLTIELPEDLALAAGLK